MTFRKTIRQRAGKLMWSVGLSSAPLKPTKSSVRTFESLANKRSATTHGDLWFHLWYERRGSATLALRYGHFAAFQWDPRGSELRPGCRASRSLVPRGRAGGELCHCQHAIPYFAQSTSSS